jgi:hypothetical protein
MLLFVKILLRSFLRALRRRGPFSTKRATPMESSIFKVLLADFEFEVRFTGHEELDAHRGSTNSSWNYDNQSALPPSAIS